MKKLIGLLLIIVVGLALLAVPKYNRLVELDNEVDNQFAQVQVVVKRRADLIPNLVETVKGYAAHEQETFEKVIQARNQVQAAQTPGELAEAEQAMTSAIGDINVVVEAYPELKANDNFRDLQAQLEGTENRIATERERYNDTVKTYNGEVRKFPMNLFAGVLGFGQREYFEAAPDEQNAPDVQF
ncbi:LemA family protein [Peptoniphilus equinus]|uniref:LemA family protein n=1 Tax=Peptoniphilus equinus TaxID=3016343 RepID=A0ABY7QU82_9FIRM|nr:LemA family protein [Peptoniphilus equinus]WBW49733.1 LemA family protein [Peptoniphilus equinus]